MTKTERIQLAPALTTHHDFGALDARGRAIGCKVVEARFTFKELPADARCWNTTPPGLYYGWAPHATRNGADYGAKQGYRYCTSEEERDAQIAKYLADARKRAARKAKG